MIKLFTAIFLLFYSTLGFSFAATCDISGIDETVGRSAVILVTNCNEARLKYVKLPIETDSQLSSRILQYAAIGATTGKKISFLFENWDRMQLRPDGHGGQVYILVGFERVLVN